MKEICFPSQYCCPWTRPCFRFPKEGQALKPAFKSGRQTRFTQSKQCQRSQLLIVRHVLVVLFCFVCCCCRVFFSLLSFLKFFSSLFFLLFISLSSFNVGYRAPGIRDSRISTGSFGLKVKPNCLT